MPEDLTANWLELHHSDGLRQFPLDPDRPCRIGRNETSTIVLTDDLVSRNHAAIQCLDVGCFALFDLGSVNGTYVDGRRITLPTVLHDGQRITIGRTDLQFHVKESELPLPPPPPSAELEVTNVLYAEELITVLVLDIRDYTGLAQRIDADALSQVIGRFFREAGKPLQAAGTWAQKYIGDAIMAVWIHEEGGMDPGAQLAAALQALLEVVHMAHDLKDRLGLDAPIRFGAGLNTGPATIGNVGSIAAADYTAVGDVVNKAFRLESATKEVHCDLLIGGETRDLLLAQPNLASLFTESTVHLKGYEQPVAAWGTTFEALEHVLSAAAPAAPGEALAATESAA